MTLTTLNCALEIILLLLNKICQKYSFFSFSKSQALSYTLCVKKSKSNNNDELWFSYFLYEDYQESEPCFMQFSIRQKSDLHKLETCQCKICRIQSKDFFQSNMQYIRLIWLQSCQHLLLWLPSCTWFH